MHTATSLLCNVLSFSQAQSFMTLRTEPNTLVFIGMTPSTGFVKEAGLKTDRKGAVIVDKVRWFLFFIFTVLLFPR